MGKIDSATAKSLDAIRQLAAQWHMELAEERVHALLDALPDSAIKDVLPVLRDLACLFHKQRRRRIEEHIAARAEPSLGGPPASAGAIVDVLEEAKLFARELNTGFRDLADRHIFQWATFYREFVNRAFDRAMSMPRGPAEATGVLRAAFATHTAEVFYKGYQYNMENAFGRQLGLTKTLNGLQRFLELPIERYSADAPHTGPGLDAALLRRTCSSMLAGILEGFGTVRFGANHGWQLLPRYPRSWVHYAGFLAFDDLESLLTQIEPGELRDGLYNTVLPVVRALDQLAAQHETAHLLLPGLGQFSWDLRRLEISMLLPRWAKTHYIEIQCYTNPSFVSRPVLEEAASRHVTVIVAGLRPDLYEWVETRGSLRSAVVNTLSEAAAFDHQASRVASLLTSRAHLQTTGVDADAPLIHNFARDFPLHQPELSRYFHVYRTSIRRLLKGFENRNGVRLWCSVRRSGKTTACFDLGATTGTSIVVSQTCDRITDSPDASLFYDSVVQALNSPAELPRHFLRDVLAACSGSAAPSSQRIVFVIDEYETLFGRLRASVREREVLRYRVVQPLLNQMVAFGRENLIVFIGQQPNSHYILMDQNQLSPYVKQDGFPLFQYEEDASDSEFITLLRKVLTGHVPFDPDFVMRRSARGLLVTMADYREFASQRLRPDHLSICPEYAFFRNASKEALSAEGRRTSPWLHVVYCCLRALVRDFGEAMTCSRSDFRMLVRDLRIDDEHGSLDPDDLLSTAASANFLEIRDELVSPRIPVLARLCSVVTPGLAI